MDQVFLDWASNSTVESSHCKMETIFLTALVFFKY